MMDAAETARMVEYLSGHATDDDGHNPWGQELVIDTLAEMDRKDLEAIAFQTLWSLANEHDTCVIPDAASRGDTGHQDETIDLGDGTSIGPELGDDDAVVIKGIPYRIRTLRTITEDGRVPVVVLHAIGSAELVDEESVAAPLMVHGKAYRLPTLEDPDELLTEHGVILVPVDPYDDSDDREGRDG